MEDHQNILIPVMIGNLQVDITLIRAWREMLKMQPKPGTVSWQAIRFAAGVCCFATEVVVPTAIVTHLVSIILSNTEIAEQRKGRHLQLKHVLKMAPNLETALDQALHEHDTSLADICERLAYKD